MSVLRDLRYAVSSLRSAWRITFALVLTLAFGVGSNAVVFGFVRSLWFSVPPVSEPSRLLGLYRRTGTGTYEPWSFAEYEHLRSHASTLGVLAAERESRGFMIADASGGYVPVADVTTAFFHVLGVTPALGSMPVGASSTSGLVISDADWRRDFGARADIIGTNITMDGEPFRVAAVAPPGFEGLVLGRPVDIWVVVGDEAFGSIDADAHVLKVIGRLRAGAELDEAQREVSSAIGTAEVAVYSLIEPAARSRVTGISVLLLIAVGLVFVVACANLVALLLSLAAARSAPLSIRVALGANRRALAQQLVADTFVLAVAGAAAGWLLALWTSHLVPVLLFAEDAEHLRIDPSATALIVTSAVSLVFMLGCTLAPMVRVPHQQPMAILRQTAERLTDTGGRLRAGLVIAQVMLSSVLLISSARLLQDFHRALHTELGDRVAGLAITTIQASAWLAAPSEGMRFFAHAKESVDHIAGVGVTAWVETLPGGRTISSRYRVAPPGGGRAEEIDVTTFDPNAFAPDRLHAIEGRLFGGQDAPRGCQVAVANEEGARAWFEGDAVGRSLLDAQGHRIDVVGIVPAPIKAAAGWAQPMLYLYGPQTPDPPGIVRHEAVHVSAPFDPGDPARLEENIAGARYFELLGLTPIAGSVASDLDVADACGVAIVNAEAADRYFGGAAVGGALVDSSGRRLEISAVTPSGLFRALQPPAQPMMYHPVAQAYSPIMTLVAQTDSRDERLLEEVRKRLNAVKGSGGVGRPERLDDFFGRTSMASERITSALVGVCAVVALVLAFLGLYSVMADSVTRRTREFGLKAALGARGRHILGPLAWEGIRLSSVGTVGGGVIAFFATRSLDRIAHATAGATDNLVAWIAVPMAVMAVTAVASLLPARRALRVDPLVVMKTVE
jgi:predicted permease